MSRGLGELGKGDFEVPVYEYMFPGNQDIVENDEGVRLVEARGQWIVKDAGYSERIGPTRVDLEPWRIVRHDNRDRIVLVTGPKRKDTTNEDIVGHHRASTQHLRAPQHDSVVAFLYHARV